MSQAPISYIDKGRKRNFGGAEGYLYESARRNPKRRYLPPLDRDSTSNITPNTRKNMMSFARWLYANVSPVRQAIKEQADLSVSSFIPQFYGEDKVWGEAAESWLYEHDKICDIRGRPYTMEIYRRNLIIAICRDGDAGTILTQNEQGYPFLQVIPAHRIHSSYTDSKVEGGPFDGANIFDGVITNEYGRALGYRVNSESGDSEDYEDIDAANMFLSFIPEYADQVRGISSLASAITDWQDIATTKRYEMTAQMAGASQALIEHNETGDIDPAKALLTGHDLAVDGDGLRSGLITETLEEGTVRYYRSGSGSRLEMFRNDRPSGDAVNFWKLVAREALSGMGWSYDFSYDPTGPGGAQMRVVIEKVNRAICVLQNLAALPAVRTFDGYRISKAIKLGLLPGNDDWWKFEYQGPARLTADAKYESDIDLQEFAGSFQTLKGITGKRGEYWEEVQDQRIREEKRLQERCKAEGVDAERVMTVKGAKVEKDEEEPQQKKERNEARER